MNIPTQVLDRKDTPAYLTTRALLDENQERGTFKPTSVDTLFRKVSDVHAALDPQDLDRPLDQSFLRYVDGKAAMAFRRPEGGTWEEPLSFTGNALSQLGYKVLGGGGTKFLESQRKQGETGRKLAEVNWNHALQRQAKPSLVRTVQLPGRTGRTARAVLSGGGRGYSVIDNIDLVEMLLEAPALRDLPVIQATVTPDLMRIRVLLNPEDAILFDPITGKLRNPGRSHFCGLDMPIPMMEVWNNEVGQGAVNVNGGSWFARCLNGLGGYGDGGMKYRWNHTGGADRAERIKAGMGEAIHSLRISASGQIEDYKASTTVAVDDAFALLDSWGERELSPDQLSRAKQATGDETSYPGRKLATVIDGITLAAQAEKDPIKQRTMEAFAARILQKGLEMARAGHGEIIAAA